MIRVGLAYDLRDDHRGSGLSEEALAELDSPETIDAIAGALESAGCAVERIGHVRSLAAALVAGRDWDIVFNIAEGLAGRSREAQVPALLEAFGVPYVFSDPLTCAATLDKGVAKRLVRDAGISTAPFAVLQDPAEAEGVRLPYPLFVKPLAEGTGKGCERASRVADAAALAAAVASIRDRFAQAAIAEAFLPGREFTVGIVGNGAAARVLGVMEILVQRGTDDDVYSFATKEDFATRVRYALASASDATPVAEAALAAYRVLGCRDAARLDFRCDARGRPQFLEVNPLAGLNPGHSDLPILAGLAGWTYDGLIAAILDAALARYGTRRDPSSVDGTWRGASRRAA